MGVSLRNAIIIQSQGNNIRCEAFETERGNWFGEINLYKERIFHTTLISSSPSFKSSKDAIEHMKGVVKDVREIKISLTRGRTH